MKLFFRILLLVVLASSLLQSQSKSCGGVATGAGASLNGFVPFPSNSLWNKDISKDTVDPNSDAIINFIGATTPLHPDFGAGTYQGQTLGIPYLIVSGTPFKNIKFTQSGDESDPGPMPVPADAPIEGYPKPGNGDRHVLVIDRDNCWLYELYDARYQKNGSWNAGSAAVWDLLRNELRPYEWTSADAAGLPIFPGLARYDEVASGQIKHALRFTLEDSRAAFVLPATHWAANSTNTLAAPMGMRLRLKADYDISSFPAQAQVILTALKRYGMIMADNGSSMFLGGDPDNRWSNDDLGTLKQVPASAFEVLAMNPVYTSANIPKGRVPVVKTFAANPANGPANAPVKLSWTASGASYFVVSPEIGAVRGNTVTVTPAVTTTYTLYATNRYGRSTATVTVTVP
jgi:hypothetical protein